MAGNPALLLVRVAHPGGGAVEALLEKVLGEAAPGLLEQHTQIAGRDAETASDRGRAQGRIVNAVLDLAQDCAAPHGPDAALLD